MGKIAVAILLILLSACNKETKLQLEGTYKGSFQRELKTGGGLISQVTIQFTTNTWSGTSTINKYPALCNGSYKGSGDIISFDTPCAFTADFDQSLILRGDYTFSTSGNTIEIRRMYISGDKDVYKLTRQ
jgi:hypothetical protein